MNITVKRMLGTGTAVVMGAAVLLGAGAGTAGADGDSHRGHCDRGERGMWTGRPGTDVIARRCGTLPDDRRSWARVEIDTLEETYYKTEYLDGGVDRKATVHDATVRCMGYLPQGDSVHWFGCVPD
ncbi:hypothetical protein [Streptomyces sp. AF1A]|uniref:hypothetical protein n=1 Tax=Streptomyces sp. AF1A TaxID=3394350 RepID=UPI0039BC3D8E